MKIKSLIQGGVVCLGLFVAGCVMMSGGGRVDVEIHNCTAHAIVDAAVWFGKSQCRAGALGSNIFKIYMYYPYPITSMAHAVWRDEMGVLHEADVDLRGVYNRGSSGVLEVGITDVGVVARLKPLPNASR